MNFNPKKVAHKKSTVETPMHNHFFWFHRPLNFFQALLHCVQCAALFSNSQFSITFPLLHKRSYLYTVIFYQQDHVADVSYLLETIMITNIQ